MNIRELSNLRVAVGGRQLLAIDGGTVAAGELLAIIDPNGAGK